MGKENLLLKEILCKVNQILEENMMKDIITKEIGYTRKEYDTEKGRNIHTFDDVKSLFHNISGYYPSISFNDNNGIRHNGKYFFISNADNYYFVVKYKNSEMKKDINKYNSTNARTAIKVELYEDWSYYDPSILDLTIPEIIEKHKNMLLDLENKKNKNKLNKIKDVCNLFIDNNINEDDIINVLKKYDALSHDDKKFILNKLYLGPIELTYDEISSCCRKILNDRLILDVNWNGSSYSCRVFKNNSMECEIIEVSPSSILNIL